MVQSRLNPNSPFFHEERHLSLAAFSDKVITIGGAGALGGNLTEMLARMGFSRLRVIDKDRVDLRNLSTQPYSRAEIGAPKARTLSNNLFRAVQAKIEPQVTELTAMNAPDLLKGSDLVVDAFDNQAARSAVSTATRSANIACLHIGFSPDGLYGSGLWEPNYSVPGDAAGDPCDYPLTRPLALMIAALAARAITDFFHEGKAVDYELTWGDLKVSRLLQ